jgi:predicted hydrocarbon binding protein
MFDRYINDLIFKRVFSFEEDRLMMMNKVPFVFFPARAMAVFVQKVTEDLGRDKATKIAYQAGDMVADEFIKAFEWSKSPLPGKMAAIKKMFEVMGQGKLDIQKWDSVNNKWLLHVTNHPVIEWGKKIYGEKQKICPFYMAIWSAHLHKEMGIENCWLIETQCIARGAKYCEMSYNYFDPSLALKDP